VWPDDPSLYICNPNKTDPEMAPPEHENLFIFVPIASGLEYNNEFINNYSNNIIKSIAKTTGITDLAQRIVYQKIFSVKDFKNRYNSFQGTALGLAHTLWQTAIFRPTHQHKKIKNYFRVGGNTNPGIGLPMCLISAELVANKIK
jgi:phytoene desaturase